MHEREGEQSTVTTLLVTGYCVPTEDDVLDFHDLGADIERQFNELSALNDAIFIDG